jgi:predicted 3-demethylubiquinone-9 3-methyltransferase (glyoxalase superfamily)
MRPVQGQAWPLVPNHPRALMYAMSDPDSAAAKRATEAMMGVRKIDLAAIERVRAG